MGRTIQLLGLFLAGFVAWMLSGSPVPMAFSLLFPFLAWIATLLRRPHSEGIVVGILFCFLGLLAMLAEIHLFRTGLAFAFRAELSFGFHLGMALIWISTSFVILFPKPNSIDHHYIAQLPGLAGFLLLFAASLATDFYDYEEWQVLPLAALPLAWTLSRLFLHGKGPAILCGVAAALCLLLTGMAIRVDRGMFQISEAIHNKDSQLSESESLQRPAPLVQDGDEGGGAKRLPRETDIQFDGKVRMILQTESPTLFQSWKTDPVYLRSSTVSVFESDELIAPVRSGRWIYDFDDEVADYSISLSPQNNAPLASYAVYTGKDSAAAIPLLPGSSALSVSAVYEYADAWYQLNPPEEAIGIRYEVVTTISQSDYKSFPSASFLRPDAPGLFLNLPPSPLAERVRKLAATFSDNDVLKEIRDRLQNETTYTLQYETPPNETPIGNLLFGDRKGHCEIYAAATVLMLRASGIPSRVAYGYAGGMMDQERKLIAFRDQDSHAWAEVLSPENEWIIYDTTPETYDAAPGIAEPGSLPEFRSERYTDLSEGSGALDRKRRPYRDRLTDFIIFFSDRFLEISLLAFLLTGGIMIWVRRRSGRPSRSASSSLSTSIPTRLNEMLSLLESCGEHLGMNKETGMTWKEWLLQNTESPACFSEAVNYYYRTRYVGMAPSSEAEKMIRHSLNEWREAHVDN